MIKIIMTILSQEIWILEKIRIHGKYVVVIIEINWIEFQLSIAKA